MRYRDNRSRPYYIRLKKENEDAILHYMEDHEIDNFSMALNHVVVRWRAYEKRGGIVYDKPVNDKKKKKNVQSMDELFWNRDGDME